MSTALSHLSGAPANLLSGSDHGYSFADLLKEQFEPEVSEVEPMRTKDNPRSIVSSVSSSLAAMMLKEAFERGKVIEIPSLNIRIQKAEIASSASEWAWW